MGSVSAICTPAIRLASVGRAAMATTSPASPAEANKLTPNCRMLGNVISMMERVMMLITTTPMRRNT